MGVDEDLSPGVIRKVVHLATKLPSFDSARDSVAETIELELKTKRIERLTERIGQERVFEREADTRAWEKLPLVEKLEAPPGVKAPEVACVSCDGGRIRRCDLPENAKSNWCEVKVGVLLEFEPCQHEEDPCPQLPDTFQDLARMDKLTHEIHRTAAEKAAPKGEVFKKADANPVECEDRQSEVTVEDAEAVVYEPPKVAGRDVIASLDDSTDFGKHLAARAWALGFAAALMKAFVADGQSTNWGIWERHFKHLGFVPILDFIHALTYVYAAAMADRTKAEGGQVYLRWITWVWEGKLPNVIAELAARAAELGSPPENAGETDPRQIVASTLTYLVNQQSRMKYPEYRRLGLPITSSHMESTVKQINQRMKGSEKAWSEEGGTDLLQLRGDQLSDTMPMTVYWATRPSRATGTRAYKTSV